MILKAKIKDLETIINEFGNRDSDIINYDEDSANILMFMNFTKEILKDLQVQLAKKEDVIDVNDIKEVKNING